jgi:hypothetical protein
LFISENKGQFPRVVVWLVIAISDCERQSVLRFARHALVYA